MAEETKATDPTAHFTYTLSKAQLQGILSYLVTKPYAEVAHLAEFIRAVPPNEAKPQVPSLVQSAPVVELVSNAEGQEAKSLN
jgi:hypothetical protein